MGRRRKGEKVSCGKYLAEKLETFGRKGEIFSRKGKYLAENWKSLAEKLEIFGRKNGKIWQKKWEIFGRKMGT